jgi:hypothetical protein
MDTQTGSQQKKHTTTGSPVITARNLVPAVIAKARANVFGGMKAFHLTGNTASAMIIDGDVRAFFERIVSRCGIAGVRAPSAKTVDDAVIDLAEQIAKQSGYSGDLDPGQVRRIAIEYVLAAVFSSSMSIEAFNAYLNGSREYRKAVKVLKGAERLTTAEAFEGSDARGPWRRSSSRASRPGRRSSASSPPVRSSQPFAPRSPSRSSTRTSVRGKI